VAIEANNLKLAEVLKDLFTPLSIQYQVSGNFIILTKITKSSEPIKPNEAKMIAHILKGSVTDEKNEPLIGASIVLEGTTKGTLTDDQGNYVLELADDEKNGTLVFSFVGYETQKVPIGGQNNINIKLKEAGALSEIVVVGYGQQKKVSVTNAVSTIKGSDLTTRPSSSMQQVLQGQAAGLTVLDQGGSPGRTTTTMRVRGITTLSNSNEALVIVDGIEQQLTNINPNDIESISVLKDAASTAIYGSRAANGVIMVTTKRAKEGKVSVSYNGYYATQNSINNPEMDMPSYMKLQQVAYTNAKIAVPKNFTDAGMQTYIDGNTTNPELYPAPNTWFQTLLHTAPQYDQNLSISGGNENMKARLSMRYQNQSSILNVPIDYGSTMGDIRLNTDFKLSSRINVSADINYRNNYSLTPINEAEVFNRFIHGTLFATPQYSSALEAQYPGITGTYGLSPQGITPKIEAEKDGTSKRWNENIFSSLKGDIKIIEGLKFSSQLAIRIDNIRQKDFTNAYKNVDLVKNITRNIVNNGLTEIFNNATEYTWNNYLNYEKSIGQNDIKALLGYSTINNIYRGLAASRQRFYNNDIQSLSQGANDGTKDNSGFDAQFGLKSYFGRVNYAFANKYLFEANGRYDGSSRFTGNNVYSFFPSFSAGWRVSEEKFFKNKIVDELKLRASWGKTGNQSVGLYSYYQSLASSAYGFNGASVVGYSPTQLANKDITWETTTQVDLGFDAIVFKEFSIGFDYYNKQTSGILLSLPIPATIGLTAPPQNAGTVENKGVEMMLGYRNTTVKNWRYGANFIIASNKNKVVSLAGTGPYISGSDIDPLYIIKEGLPINTLWGYKTDGFFKTDDEAKSYPTITTGRAAGDVKYLDFNGDGKIDANDRTVIGSSFPDFTYSFNGNVGFKNFELALFFQGASGVDTRLSGALAENGNNEGFVPKIVSTDYWTADNPNARFPRPLKRDLFNMYTSDRLVINGDYLRLKNVQLSYTLPKSLISKWKISQANVYVSATNLFTFSKLNEWGLDPEVGSGRATYYPQISTKTIGVNLQF
jgi:TonB-linked SusC/RagA family outer membrane protein